MRELNEMSETELLQTHGAVIDELMRRGVVRTRNNPVGDYTEWLVSKRLGLVIQGKSQKSFDAIGTDKSRYQIKGRCSEKRSIQFSSIRNLQEKGFDFVIAVVFNRDYSIRFAVKIPYQALLKLVRFQGHTNSHILILTDRIVEDESVRNITYLLDGTLTTPQ